MHYVYILYSHKDKGLYIGETANLKQRIKQHKDGLVKSTKHRGPLKLAHYEAFLFQKDAKTRERYLKSGYGRGQLKSQLKTFFENNEVR